MSSEQKELYEFGDFRLDVGQRRLERLDRSANGALPEKAFQTLVHLVRNSGQLLTKDALLSAIWPDTIVEENNLGKAIHAVRQCLGEKTGEQKYIETVPKHGYRFVAAVHRIGETHSRNPTNHKRDVLPSTRNSRAKTAYIALVAVLIGFVGAGVWLSRSSEFWRWGAQTVSTTSEDVSTSDAKKRLERSPAYDLYVRGKVKVASENREDTLSAIKILEDAVLIDPDLAETHAQLARGYNTMAFKYSAGAEMKRFHENAEVEIEKALTLNPELAEAHFARGLILWTNTKGFPHEQAIQSYKRSMALDPNVDETYHQLSLVYSHIGLLDEAEQNVKRALEINPNNTLARFRAGVYRTYKGKFDEAIAVFKTIPRDFTPLLVDRCMAEALIEAGRLQEANLLADAYLAAYPKDEGGSFTSVKALLLAKKGRSDEAEQAIARAEEIGRGYGHFHHTAYNIASAYAALNRPDEAVRWLENAADNGFPNYQYFAIDPNLDSLRRSQKFIEFMSKLRIQWERFKNIDGG
ncbi:MAG: winged helix-turn-helix domain-containing protein [Pyrinomonadaceae bacterium]